MPFSLDLARALRFDVAAEHVSTRAFDGPTSALAGGIVEARPSHRCGWAVKSMHRQCQYR
jgi:hypothetical protein